MEKDTVLLSLREYNDLRDFRKNMHENKTYIVDFQGYSVKYVSNDDAVKNLTEIIIAKEKEIEILKNQRIKSVSISEVKKMNIFQFLKWKRASAFYF